MTGTSSMSSGYSSWEDSESEEFFFTARTSFFRRPPDKTKPRLQVSVGSLLYRPPREFWRLTE